MTSLDPTLQAAAGLLPNAARVENMIAALADVPAFLAELGVGHPEDLYPHEVGSGAFARAFELPDARVLKLTTDRDDAEAAELVRRAGERPGLIRVFEVRRMPSKIDERVIRQGKAVDEPATLYAIVVEHVVPLHTAKEELRQLDIARKAVNSLYTATRISESVGVLAQKAMQQADRIGGDADAMQYVYDLVQGWHWLDQHGYTIHDMHDGNVGLAEGDRAVILDLGMGSHAHTERPEVPMAANPGSSKVDRVFDEAFDVVAERFPDFGDVELHEDERAGADNGAGSDRQYGYCMDGDPIVIAFAAKAEKLPLNRLRGLMRHEFGHALEYRFGVRELEKRLMYKLPPEVERRADVIAEIVWGEPIEYDGRDVQCVGRGTGRRRPKYLPDEQEVLRPNAGKVARPKRTTYRVALSKGGTETVAGWVLGDFAAHKSRYCWEVVHLPTGVVLSGLVPWMEKRDEALSELRRLYEAGGISGLPDHGQRVLSEYPLLPREVELEQDELEANVGANVTIREVETGGKLSFRFDAIAVDVPYRHATVGHIEASKHVRRVGGRVVYTVRNIYVEESHRRQGVATQLYEAAAREACRRRGRLASTARNPGAHSHDFWKKQLASGRARKVGEIYILDCDEVGGRLVANATGDTVTLPRGSLLFHGSAEEFEDALRPGPYDQVLWFADVPSIAQLYIPCAGMTTWYSADTLNRPVREPRDQAVQRMLGIHYDYDLVKWNDVDKAVSYYPPKGWEKRSPTTEEVVQLFKDKGFPEKGFRAFEVGFVGDKVVPPGECMPGRLFVARPRRDMKIYVMAHGEGDLGDVQYHSVDAFKELARRGYDGVVIDDFAQSEEWGNLGHQSLGIFGHAVADLDVESVPAQYREFEMRKWTTEDYPHEVQPYFAELGGVRRLEANLTTGVLTTYHGTKAQMPEPPREFKPSRSMDYGPGFYLATEKDEAAQYGSWVYEVRVDLKNPVPLTSPPTHDPELLAWFQRALRIKDEDLAHYKHPLVGVFDLLKMLVLELQTIDARKVIAALQRQGYDGIYIDGAVIAEQHPRFRSTGDYVVIWSPEQILSWQEVR